jgi:hypothetical protein
MLNVSQRSDSEVSHFIAPQFAQELLGVKWTCVHQESAIVCHWPFSLRSIPGQLNAISVGITKINCFTHSMVTRPLKGNAGIEDTAQTIRERSPRRIPNGKVVQASGA